jgi:hypothetical protein
VQPSSASPSVCAVVLAERDRLAPAVADQRRAPEAVVAEDGGLVRARERALATGADWIWVLDGSAVPRPGALGALVGALERTAGLVEAHLMTGVGVDADGAVAEGATLWYRRDQINVAMDAAARTLLPVRAASGSVLVRRDAAEAEAPPERAGPPSAAVLEWTAWILRGRTGYLVPESESELLDATIDARTAARLLFGGALRRFDKLRYGFELAERVTGRSAHG